MRHLSLLSLIAALVMVGFVLKRQLTVTHRISAPVGNPISTGDGAVLPVPGSNQSTPATEQVRDALDQAALQRHQQLRQLESTDGDESQR